MYIHCGLKNRLLLYFQIIVTNIENILCVINRQCCVQIIQTVCMLAWCMATALTRLLYQCLLTVWCQSTPTSGWSLFRSMMWLLNYSNLQRYVSFCHVVFETVTCFRFFFIYCGMCFICCYCSRNIVAHAYGTCSLYSHLLVSMGSHSSWKLLKFYARPGILVW